jgi:hypothetical protein
MLNCSITDTEIEIVVRNLPIGTDCMRNEYLKSTLHLLLSSYVKIFNIMAKEFNRLFNILVEKTLLKQLSRLIGL